MTETYAIETHHLRKEFGSKVAVQDLSLAVRRGEVFGFLGPNGAGKTTSIKVLLGLVAPTAGTGTLLGAPLGDLRTRARIGFLPEHFRFPDWLTGEEYLFYNGRLSGKSGRKLALRVGELLELVGLSAHRKRFIKTYSKGMLQRIGLAQALVNDPDLIFLDEPTSGLDPVGRRLVRDIIGKLREEGKAVFLNSHLLSEVEVTCDRVAFIKFGEVLQTANLKEMLDGDTRLEVQAEGLTPDVIEGLAVFGRVLETQDSRLVMVVDNRNHLPDLNQYLIEKAVRIYAFTPKQIALEDLFLEIIGTDGGL